jgi:putative hemolysin
MFINITIIILLILLNGVFAMTELAVMSSRRSSLLAKAEAGNKSAKIALHLKDDPSKFLSTVQVGITMIGIFSGAYSGVTIAEPLADYLAAAFPQISIHADDIAITLVVTIVTYLSLIIGELVPKQIALRYADNVTIIIAMPILLLSGLAKPLVYLLDVSNKYVLKLLGVKLEVDTFVSAEEVKAIIDESTQSGALEPEEKQMMDRVMRLDDISVIAAMTHRKDIVWFDIDEARDSILSKIHDTRHSSYLLCNKAIENVLGIVVLKDLVLQLAENNLDLNSIAHRPVYMPEATSILEALEKFKQSTSSLTVIVDEYGGLQGIVTLKDIMETIVGTLPEPSHRESYAVTQREDGSWLVDGIFPAHEIEAAIGIKGIADNDTYTTIAGFLINELRYIPKAGDKFDWQGWRFEVVDMDGIRIDKILISRIEGSLSHNS